MTDIIYKQNSYNIIGKCFEVHNNLGAGFLEIVYKDALEYEFEKANIPYEREKQYGMSIHDKITLEVKAVNGIADKFLAQAINYLKVLNNKLALIINFGESSLNLKRILL